MRTATDDDGDRRCLSDAPQPNGRGWAVKHPQWGAMIDGSTGPVIGDGAGLALVLGTANKRGAVIDGSFGLLAEEMGTVATVPPMTDNDAR
ncbi:hypothetical protein chiPu_0013048 [Chiloscyllium punctatum]|uniref:Uncharacterized protein n=1 Tax=Chiloscyllium punctatum TaxID=137246 RepID=A0A401SW13_CHIPU|nr:hypothetical protein [Chiloscyllium punctatum]